MMALRINAPISANSLCGGMDRLLSDVFDNLDQSVGIGKIFRATFPPINVREDEGNLYVEAEVPGLAMDDIAVSVLGNELTIKGERKPANEDEVTYHLRERGVGVGTFQRVVHLPVDVDSQYVGARLGNGVLTVTLPKAKSTVPLKIDVKSDQ